MGVVVERVLPDNESTMTKEGIMRRIQPWTYRLALLAALALAAGAGYKWN